MKKACDVAIIMGSNSDWPTMTHASEILNELGVSHENFIVSAHRTPKRMFEFAINAKNNGYKLIIAAAGGAAHLPGMVASLTELPVLGVPIKSELLGKDSLLSIVQMPKGVPVATFAIGKSGAINAALYSASIISLSNPEVAKNYKNYRENQTNNTPEIPFDV